MIDPNLRLLHGTLGEIVCKRNARAVPSRELYFSSLWFDQNLIFFWRSIRPTLKLINFPLPALFFFSLLDPENLHA